MKTFKRILVSLVVAIMVLICAPLSGFTGLELPDFGSIFTTKAEAATNSGTCGENITWVFDDGTGELVISGIGEMKQFDIGQYPWERFRDKITSVVIDEGVTSIEKYAFSGYWNLAKITMPNSIEYIGGHSFVQCALTSSLKTIIIPQAVSSIGDNAFEGCDNLTIYGYAGSYAESYAKKHSIDFEYITLTISADEYEANVFDTFVLEPSFNVLRNEVDEIVWSCEDNGVVSVSSNGEVTALKEGTANVTATSESGLYATCLVKVQNSELEVNGKVHSVSVSDISLDYKASATITPIISADTGVEYTVTYSSSNPSVVSVDANGKVSTGKTGSATITVTVTDEFGNTVSDTCEVKVNYNWWQWIIVIVLFGWIWY